MQVELVFQHKSHSVSRPDDITLSDVPVDPQGQPVVPNIGEIVTQQVCYPDDERGNFRSFKVVGKNHVYIREVGEDGGIGKVLGCTIYVIVAPADDNDLGVDFKQ